MQNFNIVRQSDKKLIGRIHGDSLERAAFNLDTWMIKKYGLIAEMVYGAFYLEVSK